MLLFAGLTGVVRQAGYECRERTPHRPRPPPAPAARHMKRTYTCMTGVQRAESLNPAPLESLPGPGQHATAFNDI